MNGAVVTQQQLEALHSTVKTLYAEHGDLPFHGWHHIAFVYEKAALFAVDLGADGNLTQAAALVHDLNYLTKQKTWSRPGDGKALRQDVLQQSGLSVEQSDAIESIIIEAEMGRGGLHLSPEAKALSDADTCFKCLPVVPVLFAHRFMAQNNVTVRQLADLIVSAQKPMLEQDLYFYSTTAKALYSEWARTNLKLWEHIQQCLDDPSITKMLAHAGIEIA